EEYSHAHIVTAREADTLQRKLDFDCIAVAGALSSAVPDQIRFPPFAGRGGVQRIHLNAVCIDNQMIGRLTRAGRIEAETDPVVAKDSVALADGCANFLRLVIETMEGEVKVAIVVGDADLRALPHLFTVQGVVRDPVP